MEYGIRMRLKDVPLKESITEEEMDRELRFGYLRYPFSQNILPDDGQTGTICREVTMQVYRTGELYGIEVTAILTLVYTEPEWEITEKFQFIVRAHHTGDATVGEVIDDLWEQHFGPKRKKWHVKTHQEVATE